MGTSFKATDDEGATSMRRMGEEMSKFPNMTGLCRDQ